jgi:hypothetical protein
MPEEQTNDVRPMPPPTAPPLDPMRSWQMWVIGALAVGFMLFPLLMGYTIPLFFSLSIGGIGWEGFLYILALLPGVIGVTHHIVSTPARRMKVQQVTSRYFILKSATGTGDGSVATREDNMASVISACAASLLLTGVFLVVAVVADMRLATPRREVELAIKHANAAQATTPKIAAKTAIGSSAKPASEPQKPAEGATQTDKNSAAGKTDVPVMPKSLYGNGGIGLILAGFGALVAVLYYMTGRLYANALSSRFLATSALRSASAIALGYILGLAGIEQVLPSANTSLAAYFLVGLFHNWAMNAMRTRALVLLGAPKSDNEELPITIVEGIEDTSADLLSEYGVSTVQHLALTDAGELSERTLIPLDRILDWTDQAILIQRVKRSVVSTRSLGIRTATDFARQYLRKQSGDKTATDLLTSIAEKSGLGAPAVETIGREFAADARVNLIYKTLQGSDLASSPDPAARFDAEVDRSLKRYDVAGLNDAVAVGRLVIRPPAPPPQ